MASMSTLRRVVKISAASRSLGYQVPSSTTVYTAKALASGPADVYQSPKQRVVRYLLGCFNNNPMTPGSLSTMTTPRSIPASPSQSIATPSSCAASLFSSSPIKLIASQKFIPRTPSPASRTSSATSGSSDPWAALDRLQDQYRNAVCTEALSPLWSSTECTQESDDSITVFTNTTGSQTWNSQDASHSSDLVPVLSPCVRLDFSPVPSIASVVVPSTPPPSFVDSSVSYMDSPSFAPSEEVQYRSVPVTTFAFAPVTRTIPGSWIEDDISDEPTWSDIINQTTVVTAAVAVAAFAVSFFW